LLPLVAVNPRAGVARPLVVNEGVSRPHSRWLARAVAFHQPRGSLRDLRKPPPRASPAVCLSPLLHRCAYLWWGDL